MNALDHDAALHPWHLQHPHQPSTAGQLVQPVIVFGKCKPNCTSYVYITGAVSLICLGTAVTVLPYCYNVGSGLSNNSQPSSSLIHLWLVGVMLIGFGIMVGVNTVFYMKSRAGITIISVDLTHQQSPDQSEARMNLMDLNCDSWDDTLPRTTNTLAFPPSYDAVVANNTARPSTWLLHSDTVQDPPSYISDQQYPEPPAYRSHDCQDPPPTYEEAMLLYDPSNSSHLVEQSECNQENSVQEEEQLNSQNSQHLYKDAQ